MKLNLGCGQNHLPGFINVDKYPEGNPDITCDLETAPWPWADSSVEAIMMNHSLEHMGQTADVFFSIIKELYRVLKPGGMLEIRVPHPRHDAYLSDPTHVRPITTDMMRLFSKQANREWKERRVPNSPLGIYLDVDFEIVENGISIEEPYRTLFEAGSMSKEELDLLIRNSNNIVSEIQILLKAVK